MGHLIAILADRVGAKVSGPAACLLRPGQEPMLHCFPLIRMALRFNLERILERTPQDQKALTADVLGSLLRVRQLYSEACCERLTRAQCCITSRVCWAKLFTHIVTQASTAGGSTWEGMEGTHTGGSRDGRGDGKGVQGCRHHGIHQICCSLQHLPRCMPLATHTFPSAFTGLFLSIVQE